jgi:hypothetical protein
VSQEFSAVAAQLGVTGNEFLAVFGAISAISVALYLLDRSRRKLVVSTLRFWVAAEQIPLIRAVLPDARCMPQIAVPAQYADRIERALVREQSPSELHNSVDGSMPHGERPL